MGGLGEPLGRFLPRAAKVSGEGRGHPGLSLLRWTVGMAKASSVQSPLQMTSSGLMLQALEVDYQSHYSFLKIPSVLS